MYTYIIQRPARAVFLTNDLKLLHSVASVFYSICLSLSLTHTHRRYIGIRTRILVGNITFNSVIILITYRRKIRRKKNTIYYTTRTYTRVY